MIIQAMCEEDHEMEWIIDIVCPLHINGKYEYLHEYMALKSGGHVTFGKESNGIIRGYGVLTTWNFSIQRVS